MATAVNQTTTSVNGVETETVSLRIPQWIYLLRHLVGVGVVWTFFHYLIHPGSSDGGSWLLDWALKLLAIFLIAFALNGAWAVFFTARSRGHFSANFVKLAWVVAFLVALGEGSAIRPLGVGPGSIASANPPPKSPTKEAKVDELRRLYPRFMSLSDAEVLRVVAGDYPDLPIDRIAADLGLKVVRAD